MLRARRKQLKLDLRAGRVLLAEALLSDADWLQTMRVRELLLATPGIGAQKTTHVLRVCRMSHLVKLGDLPRQRRQELLVALMERSPVLASAHRGSGVAA
jgi:hypothetical protein